jgi:hypothetical protein
MENQTGGVSFEMAHKWDSDGKTAFQEAMLGMSEG